jgi:hypothetical protein
VGSVVDKVPLGQGFFSEFFGFPLLISFHHGSPCSNTIWGMNNRAVGSRSSETSSHPIDTNNATLPEAEKEGDIGEERRKKRERILCIKIPIRD